LLHSFQALGQPLSPRPSQQFALADVEVKAKVLQALLELGHQSAYLGWILESDQTIIHKPQKP
jgi:hypothetical protein